MQSVFCARCGPDVTSGKCVLGLNGTAKKGPGIPTGTARAERVAARPLSAQGASERTPC